MRRLRLITFVGTASRLDQVILILASPTDVHAQRVAQEIQLLGHSTLVVDCPRAGRGLRASLQYADSSVRFFVESGQQVEEVPLANVRGVWNRRPSSIAEPPGILDDEHRRFARREWQDFLDGLTQSLDPHARIVSPVAAQRAAVKPYQLARAQRIGLRVPRTLITADSRQASDFVDTLGGRVVHKAMTSPRNAFLETRRWQETDRFALQQLELAPTIFQELIEGPMDIRAAIVGNDIYAIAMHTGQVRGAIDSRVHMDVPTTSYDMPDDVAGQLHALMASLDLSFATVDLKVDEEGRLHFLELNPQGQFLNIEILTGQPVCGALAQLLATPRLRRTEKSEPV